MKPSTMTPTLVAVLFFGVSGCSGTPTEPINTSLVGLWTLIDYQDGVRTTTPSGNWVFFDDGFMAMDLQFDYADGRTGYLAATGTFQQIPNGVILKYRRSQTTWALDFQPTEVTLRKTVPALSNNRMTLARYSSLTQAASISR